MKIGLETESFHLSFQQRAMTIFDFLKKAHEMKFDGVQINITPGYNLHPRWGVLGEASNERLNLISNDIKKYNFFCEVDTGGTDFNHLCDVIDIAKKLNADVIRTYVIVERTGSMSYADVVGNLKKVVNDLKQIEPELKKHRIKLCMENHERVRSDELISVIKEVNSPWIGLLFDFGNSMMAWEEPIVAAKNMAPYMFSTHCKDHIIVKDESVEYGHRISGIPLGDGNLDVEGCIKIIKENTMLTRINLETCCPYTAPFRRPPYNENIDNFFQGTFKVEKPIYDEKLVKLENYYRPHEASNISEETIDLMVKNQFLGVEKGLKYLRKLIQKHS